MIKEQKNKTENLYQKLNPSNWVEAYGDYLYSFACSRITEEELARDLIQDTFLAALQGINKFEGRCSERTWLTSILKYKIVEIYRKKSKKNISEINEIELSGLDTFFEAEDGHWKKDARPQEFGLDDQSAIENKEFQHILQQCMQKLPPLWLNVFTLKYLDEESTEDICDLSKISAANYWVIIHRAKLNLRACLQKNWL